MTLPDFWILLMTGSCKPQKTPLDFCNESTQPPEYGMQLWVSPVMIKALHGTGDHFPSHSGLFFCGSCIPLKRFQW